MKNVPSMAKIDFTPRHKQPTPDRLVIASLVSAIGSLAVDALLVAIGTRIFPSTKGYTHFRFSDYGKLTVIGVIITLRGMAVGDPDILIASVAIPSLAVLVTLVLLLPDVCIVARGQPAKAVAVLMTMHLAVAFVTYNSLVPIAGVRRRRAMNTHLFFNRNSRSADESIPNPRSPTANPLAPHRRFLASR